MKERHALPTWEPGVKEVAPDVYAYIQNKATWFWNNAGFIVGRDCVVVVDSLATVGLTQKFSEEIRNITDKPIRYLINTHHHGDHIWGDHVFAGATIISHRYCRQEAVDTGVIDPALLNVMFTDLDFRGIAVTPAHITFDSHLTLYMDGREVRLLHLGPGHLQARYPRSLPPHGHHGAGTRALAAHRLALSSATATSGPAFDRACQTHYN